MAALFVCTEQTLIDILLAFTDRNDMIKKDKKPWQMETAEWRFYGNNLFDTDPAGRNVIHALGGWNSYAFGNYCTCSCHYEKMESKSYAGDFRCDCLCRFCIYFCQSGNIGVGTDTEYRQYFL